MAVTEGLSSGPLLEVASVWVAGSQAVPDQGNILGPRVCYNPMVISPPNEPSKPGILQQGQRGREVSTLERAVTFQTTSSGPGFFPVPELESTPPQLLAASSHQSVGTWWRGL